MSIRRLARALPELDVRPVRQLAAAEGRLLERIHGLLFVTVALILVVNGSGRAGGHGGAGAGAAARRRPDEGAGGTVRRVMRFFLAEATAARHRRRNRRLRRGHVAGAMDRAALFSASDRAALGRVCRLTIAANDWRGARRALPLASAGPRAPGGNFARRMMAPLVQVESVSKDISAGCARSTT